jgi:hypothetical protein
MPFFRGITSQRSAFTGSALTALAAVAGVALAATPAQAAPSPLAFGFSGYYAPDNWRTTDLGSGGGLVNTAGAPASISITSPDEGAPPIGDDEVGAVLYTIRAAQAGTVRFNWSTVIGQFEVLADQDPFGYILNGVRTQLTDDFEPDQNGTANFSVARGDTFGFYASTFNGQFGPSTTTISQFTAPVPGPLPVLGVAAAFRASRKLRVLTRQTAKRA